MCTHRMKILHTPTWKNPYLIQSLNQILTKQLKHIHNRNEQESQLHKNEFPCSFKKIISPKTKTKKTHSH